MNDKIRPSHLERAAYVYIRQSSLHQVRTHRESNRRQYELKARAEQLGFKQVVVIDDDLGVSGTGSRERPGFGRLLGAVCEGKVGAVLALEASRLARNNRDWHHLIDLCVLAEALVIDGDGIYDPQLLNDRLLLGLKGTMSEFELGLLRQRAQEALRQKIARGEVLTDVPIGFVRTESNGIELVPDRQVQEAIRGVFAQFRKLGSVRQVLLWYRQEKIPLCSNRNRNGARELVWELPIYNQILKILKNPTYAGAFAYGKTCSHSHVVDGRSRKTRGHFLAQEEWRVLIRDHHPGYITWDEYMQNQKQLSGNMTKHHMSSPGAARKGSALLAGLLRCARCGRKFHVAYTGTSGRVVRYHCRGANINHGGAFCLSFGGYRADEAVVEAVIAALQPLGIEAAFRVQQNCRNEQDHKIKTFELALEKAKYEGDRARRQYDLVDPANRLVAGELEARWNQALQQVAEAEARLEAERKVHEPLSEEQHQKLITLGSDVKALWEHPAAPIDLKKRILRTVISEIIVDVKEGTDQIEMRIHWAGGAHTLMQFRKNHTGGHRHAADQNVVELIRQLARVSPDAEIASVLNRLGYQTGAGNSWTESRVRSQRSYKGIAPFDPTVPRSWLTLAEVADELKVSAHSIRKLLEQKILPAEQIIRNAPWMIERKDLQLPAVQAYVKAVKEGKRGPRPENNQTLMSLL